MHVVVVVPSLHVDDIKNVCELDENVMEIYAYIHLPETIIMHWELCLFVVIV